MNNNPFTSLDLRHLHVEKRTDCNMMPNLNQQLKQIEQDYQIVQLQFKLLLNSNIEFMPESASLKINDVAISDTMVVKQHPLISQLKQNEQLYKAKYKLERSKLLPDLFFSYNNMSMKGYGADERLYTTSTRFQSFQAGIGIPLFFSSQRSKISASKIGNDIAQNNYLAGVKTLQTEYLQALLSYNKNLQATSYYENTALKNADIILNTANKQYNNGDINYLEWTILVNQSIGLKGEYIDQVKNLNQSIIQLNYLSNK